jgi:hypothetical protein
MATAGDIAVSREYMRAQNALELSYQRLTRTMANTYRQRTVNRRPGGAPASAGRTVTTFRSSPDQHLITQMNLHINALSAYIRSHSAYYSGSTSVGTSVLRKTLSLSADSQSMGMYQATQDLILFVKSVVIGRCESAVRTFTRSNSDRDRTNLALAVQEAQFLGLMDIQACRTAGNMLNDSF